MIRPLQDIAAIVVNYGTADLAVAAVDSLLCHNAVTAVHLVDNASPGDDAATLKQAHAARGWGARVTLWCETVNHGFGRGNNVVLEALARRDDPPDAVFLLNPDARLENDAVALLAAALDADPVAVAAGAGIHRPDGTPVTAAYRFPGALSALAGTANFGPLDRWLAAHRVPLPPDHPGGPVDWVSGAAVLFRFDAIRGEGFFDPGFFLYYEEVDLMRRLQAVGGRILYVPQARVIHAEGAATGQFAGAAMRQRDPAYLYRSWAHYHARALGRGRALALALALWPAAAFNVLHRRLRGRPPTIPRRFFRDHATHVLGPLATGRLP